jgi:hypothetical protein
MHAPFYCGLRIADCGLNADCGRRRPNTLILSLSKDEPFCSWFDKLTTSDV